MSNAARHEGHISDHEAITAILAVPAYRNQFEDALAHTQATPGVTDDPREIERRLHLLLK